MNIVFRHRVEVLGAFPGRTQIFVHGSAVMTEGEWAPMEDQEAIDRVLNGDTEAFRWLVERYQARAQAVAFRVLRNEEVARDAVQDAFVKAYAKLGNFEGRSRFYTWFYRLLMNQCLDAKRRDKGGLHVEFDETTAGASQAAEELPVPEVAGVLFAPAASLMRQELREQMNRAIEALPDGPRETLLLREVEGLSYQEIAEALEIPKGTVMSRLHYARKQLQLLLVEAGVAEGEIG